MVLCRMYVRYYNWPCNYYDCISCYYGILMGYIVKYVVLDSNDIENPMCPSEHQVRYGNEQNGFFTKLEESILREGFRNPINVWVKEDGTLTTWYYGGSRLMIAKKHTLSVPCIVSDPINKFLNAKILNDVEEIRAMFKDRPKTVIFEKDGLNISGCIDSHLIIGE